MPVTRPSLAAIWPSFTLFPLAGVALVAVGAGRDVVMIAIGVLLLALNASIVANYAYFTTLRVERDELVYRTLFGLHIERVPIGSVQRIDAKRYPGAHSGSSAPHFVARGRDATVRVNTQPFRLADFAGVIATIKCANAAVELDPFWASVAAGEPVSKDVTALPRSRL